MPHTHNKTGDELMQGDRGAPQEYRGGDGLSKALAELDEHRAEEHPKEHWECLDDEQ